MFKKTVIATSLATIMVFATSIHAEVGRIVKQDDAVEADRIIIKHGHDGRGIKVIAKGCGKCPLTLDASYGAEFFKDNKPVSEEKVNTLSGRPGTVIYNAAKALVISVRW